MQLRPYLFALVLIAGLSAISVPARAADLEPTKLNAVEPKLQIPLAPNFQFSKILTADESSGGQSNTYAYIPYIGDYFALLYKYLIGAAGILAGIMITIGGFEWLMARGDGGKIKHAKSRINSAVLGLLLALGSYTILYLINPDLVTFKNLRVKLIDFEEMEDLEAETTPEGIGDGGEPDALCGPGWTNTRWPENQRSPIVSVPAQTGLTKSLITTQHNSTALARVFSVMNQHGLSVYGSGARSMTSQINLIKKRCEWSDIRRNYVNCSVATASTPKMWLGPGQPNPDYTGCTHVNSLDLFATGPNCEECASITTPEGRLCWAASECQQKLIGAMVGAGFGVLMNTNVCSKGFEPWHFNRRPEGGFQRGATDDMTIIQQKFGEAIGRYNPANQVGRGC